VREAGSDFGYSETGCVAALYMLAGIVRMRKCFMKKFIMVFSFLLLFGSHIFGQTVNARQLSEVFSNGNVTLISANGTGSISSVNGRLRNNTANEIQINVFVNNGIYLSNSGAGQNMLVLAIVLGDGVYYTSGTTKYIKLPANATTNIRFNAYCTNRDKDTPLENESFTSVSMPSDLQSISSKLSSYYVANFGKNITKPVQLALWRAQGESVADIAGVIGFTEDEWKTSSGILGVIDPPSVLFIPGTYSYSSKYAVTFSGNNFVMVWENRTYNGTYITIANTLILQASSEDFGTRVFTVYSSTAIQDKDGDLWSRR